MAEGDPAGALDVLRDVRGRHAPDRARVHARRSASARRHRAPRPGGSRRRRCRSRGSARGRRAGPADLPVRDDRSRGAARRAPASRNGSRRPARRHRRPAARHVGAEHRPRRRLSQPEELSPSELRVLRYLPTNLTRPEIARELYVSINTVNTHIRNIYSKLGARDRSSAVQRARELRLLSTGSRASLRAPRARSPDSGVAGSLRSGCRMIAWPHRRACTRSG